MKLLVGLKSENQSVSEAYGSVSTKKFDVIFNGTEEECKNYLKSIRDAHHKTKKFFDANLSEISLKRNRVTEKSYDKLYDKYIEMMIPTYDQYLLLDGEIL